MPAPRPRFKMNGQAYNMTKYSKYKQSIIVQLILQKRVKIEDSNDIAIPKKGTKERREWIKNNRYEASITFYNVSTAGDIDNLVKGYLDAMQEAGIIANDCQIDSLRLHKKIDKKNPRTEIEIIKIYIDKEGK